MDTLQELKRQIENANALGIKNLADKGVGFGGLFPPTTYEIMQGIADIIRDGGDDSGVGIQYTSIVYNDDDTITLIDTDGTPHTMVCVYEDNRLSSVTYDGKKVSLHYTDDALDMVGKTEIDLSNVKTTSGVATVDHTVTFVVDGEPYEIVSVKNGNSVKEPDKPTPTGKTTWIDSLGNSQQFPFFPEENTLFTAQIQAARTEIEITEAGTVFYTAGPYSYEKIYEGWSIGGYAYYPGEHYFSLLVSDTEEGAATRQVGKDYVNLGRAFDYNGTTYYYAFEAVSTTKPTMSAGYTEKIGDFSSYSKAAIALLDYYFFVE